MTQVIHVPEDSEHPPISVPPHLAHLAHHGRVSYITIPARDPITSAVFYEAVFGWTLTPPEGDRVANTLGPRDNAHVPFRDTSSGVSGAFVAARAPSADGPLLHIYVDDIEQVLREIEARGCEIVESVRADGEIRVARFQDPGRNVIGIWERAAS
jgi:predicted enzyme related to lactoylglutathione lyase